MTIQTMPPGYTRMGKRCEVKRALEALWSGMSNADTMLQTVREVEAHDWKTQLQAERANLPTQQIWVNPDCALKTGRWEEVVPSLKHMAAAAQKLREETHAK